MAPTVAHVRPAFRSPAPQTKVCVEAGCWAKGAPQPLEDFYPLRKGSPQRQARCRRCDNVGRLARTRAELSSLGVSPRAAANARPMAPPVEEEQQAEVEEPEDLRPETIVDRAWRVYEREERDRSGAPGVAPQTRDMWSRAFDLDEAERFANEVVAELRAGASVGDAIDRANADTSKLGAEERPLDLFSTAESRAKYSAREQTSEPNRSDDPVPTSQRAEAPESAHREAAPSSPALKLAPPPPLAPVAEGAARAISAEMVSADVSPAPRSKRPASGRSPGAQSPTGGDSALSERPAALGRPLPTPAPPPSVLRALVQVMTLDRFEEKHMPQPTGLVDRIRARLARSPAGLVELQHDLKEEPQKIRAALRFQEKRGFMRVDDAGRWAVVNGAPARGGAAHRNGAAANDMTSRVKELVEVGAKSIAAAKAAARARPASTELAGFVPPPHVAEHDQFGRDLLVLRERVIARAIARVAKIDEMLAMGFSE